MTLIRNTTHSIRSHRLIWGSSVLCLLALGCSGKSVQLGGDGSDTGNTGGTTSSMGGQSGQNSCEEKKYFEEFFDRYARCGGPKYAVPGDPDVDNAFRSFFSATAECQYCQPDYSCRKDADCPASGKDGTNPVCIDNWCRLPCESDADCPDILDCVEDRDGNQTCALAEDPFGELDLRPSPRECSSPRCATLQSQKDCEAVVNNAEHYIVSPCVWVEEHIFHDNGNGCREVSSKGSCQGASFELGANVPDSCGSNLAWADYGGGTVSLLTTSQCNYRVEASNTEVRGTCDPQNAARPAVCDCACQD